MADLSWEFSETSVETLACQNGSLDALAIMEERHWESIETSFCVPSLSWLWHTAQFPEPVKLPVVNSASGLPELKVAVFVVRGATVEGSVPQLHKRVMSIKAKLVLIVKDCDRRIGTPFSDGNN